MDKDDSRTPLRNHTFNKFVVVIAKWVGVEGLHEEARSIPVAVQPFILDGCWNLSWHHCTRCSVLQYLKGLLEFGWPILDRFLGLY